MTDQYLGHQADLNPEAPFLVTKERTLTYGQVDRLVEGRARDLGERAGEQVVVRPRIDVESVVEILAVARTRATALVISPSWPDDLAATQIEALSKDGRPSHSILFTSGSSGIPKGVRLSASNWEAAASASIGRLGHGPTSRWLCPLPLHHVGGLSIIYRSMAAGGSVVLAPEPSEVASWMGRVQFASMVPTQLYRVLQSRTEVFANGPVALIGGGASPPSLLDQAGTAGIVALPTYGMTETTSQVATALPGDPERRLFPLEGIEVRIGSEDRIQVKGPSVSLGYVGEPERSDHDWFATADRGRIEPAGSLVVFGRLDRMIISGGENVDPDLVEAAIESHPDVFEVAVIALPDKEWGQLVAAAYSGPGTPEQLRAFLLDRLPPPAIPKRWLHVELIPRTELGKVNVAALVAMFDS